MRRATAAELRDDLLRAEIAEAHALAEYQRAVRYTERRRITVELAEERERAEETDDE